MYWFIFSDSRVDYDDILHSESWFVFLDTLGNGKQTMTVLS